MNSVAEVRLYRNTVNEVPAEYTVVTEEVLNSVTKLSSSFGNVADRYVDGVAKASGVSLGSTYYFWVEVVDARGGTAGPRPVGSGHIRLSIPAQTFEDHGNNIVANGGLMLFNGVRSYTSFDAMMASGVDYGDYVRSGTWSATFWIKSSVEPTDERRFFSIRKDNDGMVFISNQVIASWDAPEKVISLAKDAWYFFAVSVDDHQWMVHTSADDPLGNSLASSPQGTWDASGVESNRMFIGINNGWDTQPSMFNPFPWDGYACKFSMDDRPLSVEDATAIYRSSRPE